MATRHLLSRLPRLKAGAKFGLAAPASFRTDLRAYVSGDEGNSVGRTIVSVIRNPWRRTGWFLVLTCDAPRTSNTMSQLAVGPRKNIERTNWTEITPQALYDKCLTLA